MYIYIYPQAFIITKPKGYKLESKVIISLKVHKWVRHNYYIFCASSFLATL